MTLRPSLLLAALALAACSPSLIPGTDVQDTKENRAVYGVIRAYAQALQNKDAAALLAVVAPDYFDDAGTLAPEDDLDRAALERSLATDLPRVDSLKLEIGIKRITVNGDRAQAELYFDDYFRVVTPNGAIPKRQSDLNKLSLRKYDGTWKITAGL